MAIFREENPNQNVVEYNETERRPDAYDIAPVRDPMLYDSVDNYRKTYWSIDEFNKGGAIKSLYERYTDVIGNQRGVMVTNNGYISHDEKVYDSNAVILGAAAVNKTAIDDNVRTEYRDESFTLVPVAIAETRNQSFRYLTMNPDNNRVEDAGPVCHTCFVGGNKAPTHLIVPLTERQAIEDAQYLLESFHDAAFGNQVIEGEYIDKDDDEESLNERWIY